MANFAPKVSVLGTDYKIIVKKYDEDISFSEKSINGYCNSFTRELVLCDMSTYSGWEDEPKPVCKAAERATLRHEIVHAFFNESGLADCSFSVDSAWSKNEELVDWIALQGQKIYKAWGDSGCLDE